MKNFYHTSKSSFLRDCARALPNYLKTICYKILLLGFILNVGLQVSSSAQSVNYVTSTSGQSSGTSLTFTHDRGSAANTLTLVSVQLARSTTLSSITYGGNNMTLVGSSTDVDGGTRATVYIYSIFNAPTGNQNIVINVSGTNRIAAGATSFSNVDSSTPLRAYTGSNGTGANDYFTANLNNVATGPGEIVFSAISYSDGTINPTNGSGQTQRWNEKTSTADDDRAKGAASTKPITSGSTTSITYSNLSDSWWAAGAVSVRPVLFSTSAVVTNASCPSGNNGFIDLTVNGGTPSFTYSWTGPNSFTSTNQDISGLIAGTYSVTVTDNSSLQTTASYTVSGPSDLTDTDGDGVINACDADDDNDGILDTDEGGGSTPITVTSPTTFSPALNTWQASAISVTAGTQYTITPINFSLSSQTVSGGPFNGQTLNRASIFDNSVGSWADLNGNQYSSSNVFTGTSAGIAIASLNLTASDYPRQFQYLGMVDVNGNGQYNPGTDQLLGPVFSVGGSLSFTPTVSGQIYLGYPDSFHPDNAGTLTFQAQSLQGCGGTANQQLNYGFYDGAFSSVTQIPTSGALSTGLVSNFDNNTLQNTVDPGDGDDYGIRYTGFINIATAGTYTFYTDSDDGSKLFINNTQVVDNDGVHGNVEVSGTITLTAGWHSLEVLYFEQGGFGGLSVSYAGPSISKQALPFSILSSVLPQPCTIDTDGDGIDDSLDTDSDNDGCADAIEGGGSFTASSIDGNGRLTGGVNTTTGIPTVAGAGQTIGQSQVATQLIVNTAPSNQTVIPGAAASFSIATTASNTTDWSGPTNARVPAYGTPGNANAQRVFQWYLGNPDAGGTILTNTGVYTGVNTATLNISNSTGLFGNVYYVVVTHSNNSCIREVRNASLNDACATLSGTINSQTNVSCFGGSNGTISVSGNGGTAPYSYRLDAGAFGGSGTFTGIAPGAHTVTVRDANLCTFVVNFTITQPAAALAVTPTLTQPACFAFGGITLSVSGGTAPYTYDWADIPGTNNVEDRSGLSAGNYSVTVTDANGCTVASSTLTLNAPANCGPITVCQNTLNSVFSVAPHPDNSSYTWTVPMGAIIVSGQGTPSIVVNWSGVTPGAYQVCVVANNVCGTSAQTCQNVNVVAPPTPNAMASPACTGGDIQLFASGGGTYSWSGPNGFTSASANPIITNANAATHNGTYMVTVTNTAGCVATGMVSVTVSAPPQLSVINTNNATCGQSNGVVNLSVVSGTPTFTYIWSNGAVTQDLSNVPSGTYQVTVTDAAGCTATLGTSISDTPGPVLTETHTDVSCFGGSNGSINLTITGGTPPQSIQWSNGSTMEDLSGLAAGNYGVTVTDASGCVAARTVTITQPDAITLDFTKVDVNCFGGATGSINLIVAGGTGSYTYNWTRNGSTFSGNNTQDLTLRTAGTYAVTVTDANGCTATTSIIITQPTAALSATPTVTNVDCFGGSNGQVILTVTNGTAPYTYAWTGPGGFTATTKDIVGRIAGSYNVTVTDAKGCTFPLTGITITQPTQLAVSSAVPANVSCFGGANGSINATIAGGTAPYTYLWSNGATVQDPSGLTAGTYTLTVTDFNGCTAVSGNITVGQPAAALTITPTVTNVNCFGASTGSVSLVVSGGTPTYTFAWSGTGAGTNPRTGLAAGNYTLTVTDANTCTAILPVSVNQNTQIAATSSITNVSCNGGNNASIALNVNGGSGPYTFTWSGTGTGSNPRTGLSAGMYSVTITDALLCTRVQSFTVTQPATLSANGTVTNVTCNGAANGMVNLSVTGGTSPYTFAWSNGANTEDVSNLAPGSYTVTVTDFNLCTTTQSFTITEPNLLAFTSSVVPNCAAQSNGSITLNVSGGTGPFTYNWSGTGTGTNPRTNLAAGTYNVTVTDARGCTATGSFTLVPLTVFVTGTSIYCEINGTAEALPDGGLQPYTYLWNNNATTSSISNLGAGTYIVTVTAGACTATGQITLTQPSCLPPVAVDDQYKTLVNTPVSGMVRPNDTDPVYATSTLNIEPITTLDPSIGVIVWDPSENGNFVFTPATNFIGVVMIDYQVCNPLGLCDVGVLTITINSTNAQNDINQTPINVPVNGNVLTNDNDPQGDTQTVTSALADTDGDGLVDENLPVGTSTTVYGTNNNNALVVAGTVLLNSNGTYTYTPALNFTGNVPFAYTITDSNTPAATDAATVSIEVAPASVVGRNEPPIANDDTNTTEKDVNVSGSVFPNDSDPDGDVITVTSALADTNGDGQVDNNLPVGVPTFVFGTNVGGNLVLAGEITLNANGTYTFNPQPTFTGEVPVRYTISDPGGLMDDARLTITITENFGNATYANDDANSGPQGQVQTGNILTNDFDPEGNTQTVTAALSSTNTALVVNGSTANPLPSGGTLVLASNGAYTYTPAPGFVGTEIVRYTATDNGSPIATDVATLYLTTLPINNTFAQNDINQTPVNVPVSGNVLTNDNDPQGDTQTVTSALADTDGDGLVDENLPLGTSTTIYGTNNANMLVVAGTVTLNSNGTYTYTPALNYQGTVPFAYTVTDNNVSPATDRATVAIEVIPTSVPGVNEPPVANDDTNTTEQDVTVSDNVLPNDSDPDGDPITVTSALADTDGDGSVDDNLPIGTPTPISGTNTSGVTVPAGTITLNTNGTYTFDPLPTFLGEVPVRYTISDPGGLMDAAVLTITVIPNLGNVTIANDDANSGPQGQVQTGNILTNDFDPEGNTQTVTAALNSANTALVVNGSTANPLPSGGTLVLAANGAYTYTPAPNFVGTEIVRYTATDNGSPIATDVATLYLTTLPINNTFAQNDINQTPVNVPVSGNVLTNDNDPQGNTQTVTSALADTDGDGQVDDNLPLGSSTTVYGTNNANMVVVAGTVTLNPNGTYTYTPALNYQGTVPFAYTVTDNNPSPATDRATVAIEVIPASVPGVNEPPVANDDTNTTEQDVTVSDNVLPNDSDPDGDPITVTSALADTDGDGSVDDNLPIGVATPISGTNTLGVTVPAGTITLNTNGTYTFDPLPTFLGEVPVRYTISDPGGLMDAAVLTITVIPNLGNVTVANDDANSGPQGQVQTGNIVTNDFDPEGNTQTVTAALNSANTALVVNGSTANALPSGGTLVLAANGAYTYTPAPNFIGTEIVRYTATDNGSPIATDVATLYLTTLPINNTFAQNDINQTPVNVPVSGNVLTNDNDPQGDTQTVTSALADTDGDGLVDENLPLGTSTTIYGTNNANMLVVAGTVTLNANGTYTYTPALDYQGTVPFAYTVTDNNPSPATDKATVTIEVIPESIPGGNEPPVANDDTNTTEQDVNVSGFVLPNDSDPDGDPITVTSALADTDNDGMVDDNLPMGTPTPISGTNTSGVTVPAGTITLNTNGTYTFDPLPTFLGEVPVRYTISDPGGLMDAAVLTITVIPNLGNVTFANDDANSGPQGQVQTGNILLNDFDPEGNTQTVTAAQNSANTALVVNGVTANPLPSGGTLVLFANGAYTYTPAVGFVGTEIVRYTATDNGSPIATDVATLYLTTLPFGCITIEAYVYLEGSLIVPQTGLYQAPPMRTALNNLGVLPGQSIFDIISNQIVSTPLLGASGQAYNIAPWNYQGAEGNGFNSNGSGNPADAGYSTNVVDWVLVALRNGPSASAQIVCQRAGLLYRDGHIEFVNDGNCCILDQGATYYLTIEHRNHLIVMSHTALPVVNGKITYDFRNKESYIDDPLQIGVFVGQKQVQTGVFAMFAGNGDQSLLSGNFTDINAADFGKWLNNSPRFLTYSILDYNMDGDVSALDFELWLRNTQKFTSVPQR